MEGFCFFSLRSFKAAAGLLHPSLSRQTPSEDKPAHCFVLEAGKHESAMQEKPALQGILRIT